MFKDGKTAKKAMLRAGVGSTMPMRIDAILSGWQAITPNADGSPEAINSLIAPMVQIDGPNYASQKADKPS
jgi:hypothetical protein